MYSSKHRGAFSKTVMGETINYCNCVVEVLMAVVRKRGYAGSCRGMQAYKAVDWLGIAQPTVQVPGRWQLNGRRRLETETKSTSPANICGKRTVVYLID